MAGILCCSCTACRNRRISRHCENLIFLGIYFTILQNFTKFAPVKKVRDVARVVARRSGRRGRWFESVIRLYRRESSEDDSLFLNISTFDL